MTKFLKSGKVVIILQGKYAGKKAVIIKTPQPPGGKKSTFSSVVVVGLSKAPTPLKKNMSQKQKDRATAMRPFVKLINTKHIMPTRYTFDGNALNKVSQLVGGAAAW